MAAVRMALPTPGCWRRAYRANPDSWQRCLVGYSVRPALKRRFAAGIEEKFELPCLSAAIRLVSQRIITGSP